MRGLPAYAVQDRASSNYRVCKPQANKSPLRPSTKQAPARTSKQTKQARTIKAQLFPSPSSISILPFPLHPRFSTRSSYSSFVCPGAAAKLPTTPPSLRGATEKWSGWVGAKRETCVVRNRRSGAGRPLSSCAGRTSGANLGVDPTAAGHPPRCSVSVASPRLTVTFIPVPAVLISTHRRFVSHNENRDNKRTAAQPTGVGQPSSRGKCVYYPGGTVRALLYSS
jgi:hypothetical protein